MKMSNKYEIELFRYQEDLETISLQLENLHSAVDTMSIAFQQQKIENDVIGCFEATCYAITGMKQSVDKRIKRLIEINNE